MEDIAQPSVNWKDSLLVSVGAVCFNLHRLQIHSLREHHKDPKKPHRGNSRVFQTLFPASYSQNRIRNVNRVLFCQEIGSGRETDKESEFSDQNYNQNCLLFTC